MKKCPYCAEEIQDEAIFCKHCSNYVDVRPLIKPPTSDSPETQRLKGQAPALAQPESDEDLLRRFGAAVPEGGVARTPDKKKTSASAIYVVCAIFFLAWCIVAFMDGGSSSSQGASGTRSSSGSGDNNATAAEEERRVKLQCRTYMRSRNCSPSTAMFHLCSKILHGSGCVWP